MARSPRPPAAALASARAAGESGDHSGDHTLQEHPLWSDCSDTTRDAPFAGLSHFSRAVRATYTAVTPLKEVRVLS